MHNKILASLILSLSALTSARALDCGALDYNTVATCVGNAAEGETVNLPAGGPVTWSNTLTISKGITLKGQTIVQGDFASWTAAIDGGADYETYRPTVNGGKTIISGKINILPGGGSGLRRITQITFKGPIPSTKGSFIIGSQAGTPNVRIDHCEFADAPTDGIEHVWFYSEKGVIDHCVADPVNGIFMHHQPEQWGGLPSSSHGDKSWSSNPDAGYAGGNQTLAENKVYMENNFIRFTGHSAVTDAEAGARFVVRKCVMMSDGSIQNHGAESGYHRSSRLEEIYDNRFYVTAAVAKGLNGQPVYFRGGTGFIFNNICTTKPPTLPSFVSMVSLNYYPFSEVQLNTCQTWMKPVNNGTRQWDYEDAPLVINPGPNTGKPCSAPVPVPTPGNYTVVSHGNVVRCLDQPAAGKDQRPFTNNDQHTLGVNCAGYFPDQDVEPVYIWGNSGNGVGGEITDKLLPTVTKNYDFFTDDITFSGQNPTGAVGVRSGLDSAKPTTGGVANSHYKTGAKIASAAYWATDTPATSTAGQGALYANTANNVWTLYYRPAVYPHSLVSGTAPSPAITSDRFASFVKGQAVSCTGTIRNCFTVTTQNFTSPVTITQSGGSLPADVSFSDNHDGTATISGPATTATPNSYPFTITATHAAESDTQAFTLTVSAGANNPPTVSFSAPTPGQNFLTTDTINFAANAADSDGITSVDFYPNATGTGSAFVTDKIAPYTASTSGLVAGSYTYSAKATDGLNGTSLATVGFTVSAPPTPTPTPTPPASPTPPTAIDIIP